MSSNEVINYIKSAFELKEQKYYKQAIEMLYKALEIENDNIELLSQIGDLYYLLKNYERASKYFEKVLYHDPTHELAQIRIYEISKRTGDKDETLKIAQNLFNSHKNSENLKRLVEIIIELNLLSEIDQYANSEYFNDEVRIECANALYKCGETEKARDFLSNCNQDNEQTLLLLGKMKYDDGDFVTSKSIFNRISSNTQNPEVLNFLGLFELENMNFIEAIKYFSMASNIDKNNDKYYYNLGNAYFYNGWIKEARDAYLKALYISPVNFDYRYSLAYLYYSEKDYDKSEKEVDAILSQNPEYVSALVLKALIYAHNNKLIEACALLNDCIKLDPKDDFAKTSLSKIYIELGNYNKARAILEQTKALKSEDESALCDLCNIYILQKEFDSALDIAEKLIEKNPNYIYAYILGAKASYQKEDYEKSKEFAQDAISLDINYAPGYYYLSLTRQAMDDVEEAIECMKRAILYDLNNPEYYAKMSEYYEQKQDYKSALEYISEADKLANNNDYKARYSNLAKLCRKNLQK